MQLFYLCPRITKKMTKSCKDAMKLISPQCVLHKFLLLQDVAARCPFNLTPGPRLHNADVVLENVTLTFDSKNTPIMFLKNGSRYGLWALELRAECEENRKSLIISIPSPSRVTPIFRGAVTEWKSLTRLRLHFFVSGKPLEGHEDKGLLNRLECSHQENTQLIRFSSFSSSSKASFMRTVVKNVMVNR